MRVDAKRGHARRHGAAQVVYTEVVEPEASSSAAKGTRCRVRGDRSALMVMEYVRTVAGARDGLADGALSRH